MDRDERILGGNVEEPVFKMSKNFKNGSRWDAANVKFSDPVKGNGTGRVSRSRVLSRPKIPVPFPFTGLAPSCGTF